MSPRPPLDLRLMAITAGPVDRALIDRCVALARGGAGVIQVRDKAPASTRALLDGLIAIATAVVAAAPQCRVLVDDRADVALAARLAGAPVAGVHLGQDDLPIDAARRMLGPDALIGLTTGTLGLVAGARRHGDAIDYLGAGPFRPTPTKDSGRPPLGFDGYPPLVAAAHVPIVAIGDVGPGDVAGLAGTGVAGVAMVRALMSAADPAAVAAHCLEEWDRGRG